MTSPLMVVGVDTEPDQSADFYHIARFSVVPHGLS